MTDDHGALPTDLAQLGAAAARVAAELGLRLVVLFGSAARGEAAAEDLDLGVLGDAPLDVVAVTNAFIRALSSQRVDIVDLGRADPVVAAHVARDGIALYDAEAGGFARFASLSLRRFADTAKFREMERQQIRDFIARHAGGS
jgi:predicted nucleotidyltransferase